MCGRLRGRRRMFYSVYSAQRHPNKIIINVDILNNTDKFCFLPNTPLILLFWNNFFVRIFCVCVFVLTPFLSFPPRLCFSSSSSVLICVVQPSRSWPQFGLKEAQHNDLEVCVRIDLCVWKGGGGRQHGCKLVRLRCLLSEFLTG